MRIGGFRIGFALVGSALLAASVTSIAIAAQDHRSHGPKCYSTCPTRTRLTTSSRVLKFGSEDSEVFTVVVKSKIRGVSGNPIGTAVVMYRSITLCTVVLTDYGRHKGRGTCSPAADALPARHKVYRIRAFYGGSASFTASHARRRIIRVIS